MAPSPRTHARLRANDEREIKSKALTMFSTGSAMPTGLTSPMRDKIRTELTRLQARSNQNRRMQQASHRRSRINHQRAINHARISGGTKKRRKTRRVC